MGGRTDDAAPATGRGGKRANQTGRPRSLVDPVSRSFTIERADLARLEALAVDGRTLADVHRAAVAAGLEALERAR